MASACDLIVLVKKMLEEKRMKQKERDTKKQPSMDIESAGNMLSLCMYI